MTTLERKFEVIKQWGSITAGAKKLEVSRSQLSYCIHRKRKVPALRKKLATALGITVEELFDDATNRASTSEADLNRSPNSCERGCVIISS